MRILLNLRSHSVSRFTHRLLLTALAAGWTLLSAGQTGSVTNELAAGEGFVFRSWRSEDGLPQNTVSVTVQTRDGYLWLGTQAGLARFDGVRFKVYGLADGLPSAQVRALHEDEEGSLWIGTFGGGVSRLRAGHIETFTVEDGLSDINVTALAGDAAGRLWIGSSTGVSQWQNGKFLQEPGLAGLGRKMIRTLLRDRHDAIWISASHGLFEFKNGRLTESVGPPGDEKLSPYCLLEDRAGNLWASIGNGKVLCRRDGVWGKYDESSGLPLAYVTSLAESEDGTIWAGSLDAGLYYFKDGRFIAIRKNAGLSGDDIRSLLADREGNLWVGTRSAGLNQLVRRKLLVYGAAQGLMHDFVRSVAEAGDGTLWVGTTGGGLYRGRAGQFAPFTENPAAAFYVFVESVLTTRDESLWWGGNNALLHWQGDHLAAAYTRSNQQWIADTAITALTEDARGDLWIGTSRGSLIQFRNGEFTPFGGTVARGAVTAFAQETDGTLWVGSVAGGLSRVRDGAVTRFSTTNGLPSDHIRALHLDRQGSLWIGTGGAGLCRWQAGHFDSYTTRHGLGDDTISQILEDDDGNLWLGCNRGIYRIRLLELEALAAGELRMVRARAYGTSDGMPADECASGFSPAGLKLKSGQLCFSTIRGLVVIDPRQQQVDPQPPRVLVEEVLVDRQIQQGKTQFGGDAGGWPPQAIEIAPGSQEIDFRYTGLSFAAPEKVRFRFRLRNWDHDWIEAGDRRVAYYQRISPGNYVFEVRACNADGVWSYPGATLAVTLQPYLWETTAFRLIAGSLLAGLLVAAVNLIARRRYRRRLAQLETQHAIERERLRISQDMHDDIGGILTRVSILSDVGQGEAGREAAAKQFERIGSQVRAAVVALDEIVWATNPQDDNLPRFAEYVGLFADQFFENTTVRCWQEMPTDLPKLPLRADVRHNVFLAVKEALHNVLKHSGATEVWLRLKLANVCVSVEIEDNGRGFVPDAANAGGHGLGNMKSRLAECGGSAVITSAPACGAKVQFDFPLPGNL